MFQHDVCPDAGPRALKRVPIRVVTEAGQGVARDVVADLPQGWVARRRCKDPLEHLEHAHRAELVHRTISGLGPCHVVTRLPRKTIIGKENCIYFIDG